MKADVAEKMPPMMNAIAPTKMIMEYDDATGTQLAVKTYNAKGDETMVSKVIEINVNTGLDKGIFTYTPPAGVTVRDMTAPPKPPEVPPPPAQ